MGPLNLTVTLIVVAVLVWELSGLVRPDRLLPGLEAPPSPGAPHPTWQSYVLLPAPLPADADTAQVDRAVATLLAGHPTVQVVVIDRGDPGPVVARSDRVAVVHVVGPEDHDNIGAFLNAGLDVVLHDVQRRALDPDAVVVGVLDLGSRLPGTAVDAVVERLQDPTVAAVQLEVRATPRAVAELDARYLSGWAASVAPRARTEWFGAPSHPRHGHFHRLSALLKVDDRPWWTTVPSHDVDLALSYLVDGWSLLTAPDIVVAEPPVTRLRDALRIRTRAMHAGLNSTLRLRELWRSPDIDNKLLARTTARIVSHWFLTVATLFLVYGAVQLLLAVPRGDLGHLGLAPTVLLAFMASRLVVFVVALWTAVRLRLGAGTEPSVALGLTLAAPFSVLGNLRAIGRSIFRLGGYVGVDEFQVSGIGLAVARPASSIPTPIPTLADLPPGPVRLRARITETRARPRRRR
ncbi:MAG: hypothetical protein M3Z03_04905 [Actinomycetota bacterium]|nr:hypothetical protein [Actinomycetota bacterium]